MRLIMQSVATPDPRPTATTRARARTKTVDRSSVIFQNRLARPATCSVARRPPPRPLQQQGRHLQQLLLLEIEFSATQLAHKELSAMSQVRVAAAAPPRNWTLRSAVLILALQLLQTPSALQHTEEGLELLFRER